MGSRRLRFELFVRDVAVSVDFYRAVLGLEPHPGWVAADYVAVSDGVVEIGLQRLANLAADHHFSAERRAGPLGVGVEIVVEVDDVERWYRRALAAAAPFGALVEPLGERPWGRTDFRVVDPDGYYLRVTS